MPPEYVSIRILPEAKEAIMRVANKHETISGTIIRICDYCTESRYAPNEDTITESQYTSAREPDTDEWKRDIERLEGQIAELRDYIYNLTPLEPKQEEIKQVPDTELKQDGEPVIETIEPPAPLTENEEGAPDTRDTITKSHAVTGERRDVSERGKEMFVAIFKRGTDIEGKQSTFVEKVGISSRSVVSNLVNGGRVRTMSASDIDKTIEYARSHCPELLKEYSDVMQQYESSRSTYNFTSF